MKIIAVNINKALASTPKPTVLDATKRAWKLNIKRCKDYDYVIGVVNGHIKGFFRKTGEYIDLTEPLRVKFDLKELDATCIRECFQKNENEGLKRFTVKYIEIDCNCQDIENQNNQ